MTPLDPRLPRAPFTAFIGGEIEEVREGYCRVVLPAGPQHAGPDGFVHGGVITTLIDTVIGIALGNLRGEVDRRQRAHATVDMNTSFLDQASPGERIIAEGSVINLGETVAFGEVEARTEDGRIIARGRLAYAITERRR